MSVMLLEDCHFNAIVNFASIHRPYAIRTKSGKAFDMQSHEDCQAVASLLLAANVAAYAARYGEECEESITFTPPAQPLTPVEVLKALDVLEYQCEDADGFDGSDASDIINAIRRTAITKLAGYEDAPWGIE